jgi:hypothetical protein
MIYGYLDIIPAQLKLIMDETHSMRNWQPYHP